MTRRVYTRIGESQFWIEDTVENRGADRAALMILQHMNVGFPLLDERARLLLPRCTTTPRDAAAQRGMADWNVFSLPEKHYAEQVFYHDCEADQDGFVQIALVNRDFELGKGIGLYVQYQKAHYPMLVEWKMMKQGMYVCGLEPSNCRVEGRAAERERGTLVHIEPGESRRFDLEVGVLYGARELDSIENDLQWAVDDTGPIA
jgi:hypothetical protein